MNDKKRAVRLDYKILHNTGEKVEKTGVHDGDEPTAHESSSEKVTVDEAKFKMTDEIKFVAEEATIAEDLDDFMEENPADEIADCIDDYDVITRRVEELRSLYRCKHNQLKEELKEGYKDRYESAYIKKIESIKCYITVLKKRRRLLRDDEDNWKKDSLENRQTKVEFLEKEIERSISSLEAVFIDSDDTKWKSESDTEITKRKTDVVEQSKEVEKLSTSIKDVMDSASGVKTAGVLIQKLKKRYDNLMESKCTYVFQLNEEIKKREIDEHKAFNKTKLNIKLPKFKGYKSSTDIYSFQSDFEKLYLKSTPKILLPDLLKNNFLENPALLLVKDVRDIDDIWRRLKEAYGDCKIMLSKKLAEINNIDALGRYKDPEKTIDGLSKIINLMKDLMHLAKQHDIENKLYHGDGLEKIHRLMGDYRFTRWLSISCDRELEDGEEQWKELILFLEKEVKIFQQKVIMSVKTESRRTLPVDQNPNRDRQHTAHLIAEGVGGHNSSCYICGATDHVATNGPGGTKLIQYFVCQKFVEMTPVQRFWELKTKGLCFQCLFPGAEKDKGKHKDGRCQRDFVCTHPSHERYIGKKHVLVCEEHKSHQQNKDILQEFKRRCILKQNQVELPSYTKDIQLHHAYICRDEKKSKEVPTVVNSNIHVQDTKDDPNEDAIYMLQTINVDEKRYTIFYDTGCREFVSKYDAIRRLGSRANEEHTGPITLGGVGGITTKSPHGIFSVKLPLRTGGEATLTGACMDVITETFPSYPLKGKVEGDIKTAFIQSGGDVKDLPEVMANVGGNTDFMFGIKYLRYFPKKVFQLPSGLTIYRSEFKNADGSDGVIGGPHKIFSEIEKQHYLDHQSKNFISRQYELFKTGYQVNPDVSILGYKENNHDVFHNLTEVCKEYTQLSNSIQNRMKKFQEAEEAGSEIQYRCVKCRSCKDCKNHDHNEAVSIKEEIEQDAINRSVTIDIDKRITIANLPLMKDPIINLCPNKSKALKVYKQQLKRLSKNVEDKASVIKAEGKLQDMGFVDYVENLPHDVQKFLQSSPIKNFLPWRVVWKDNSMSTPCRPVFDASQPTDSGLSLNDIVAKGRNNMNKMVEIFIRWRSHKIAFHNDVQKMYNAVKLQSADWCFQRYLWEKNLDPEKDPLEKVIMTLIYGVKSSGNQAEHGVRLTAEMFQQKYPEVHEIILRDLYVDDCMSGSSSQERARRLTDELEIVLNHGGFTLKGFTVSGTNPEESLTSDGSSICIAGQKWYPKEDLIALDIKELNFAKKNRGRKNADIHEVPKHLTRRMCTSKVAEIFDPTGMLTPITATMKLDLHDLVTRQLDWDHVIPDNLKSIWNSHFEMMKEIKNIRYNRAIVPADAVDLRISTLDFGDASKSMICVAIYARFERKCGTYSCQLIFARSRLVPTGMSQPRAELYAAVVNTHAGETVRRAFYKSHQRSIKFTDSQIVLHWISNNTRALKQWVRSRSIEIARFTDVSIWRYVASNDMAADIGTRRCLSLSEVDKDSVWINGQDWMREDESKFPCMSVDEISLSSNENKEVTKETEKELTTEGSYYSNQDEKMTLESVRERYQYSNYIIDPNRHRFQVVVRILALVRKFIKNIRQSISLRKQGQTSMTKINNKDYIFISDDDMHEARKYFHRKSTLEIQRFLKPTQYSNISKEVDGLLIYTGRVLPEDEVTIVGRATEAMKDLCSTTFCVPLADKYSPVAYSIINDIHWHDKSVCHSGVETTWRYVLKNIYVIEGRSLVKKIRASCQRCRYLSKKALDVTMGPISRHQITIAPAFYICQLDLAGPFPAYSYHNKRATIKIWLSVFCCTTTSATNIKVMENYSSTAFLQAFARFSCEVGYPKHILADEGSQLIKGCESMRLDMQDLKFRLQKDVMVELEVCPVGGHNMHGKVERKIREIKQSLAKTLSNQRLGIMQWETISSTIANSINNLPLALGNIRSNFELMDLITPNRLLLGRNNDRCPVGALTVSHDYDKIIRENQKVFNAWFENWLLCHVPKLMEQPKWFRDDRDLKEGDIVMFLKQESEITSNYQFGIVQSVEIGRDGRIRKVKVRYRNHSEGIDRETYRSARSLVIIHSVDELNIMQELGDIARKVENDKRKVI